MRLAELPFEGESRSDASARSKNVVGRAMAIVQREMEYRFFHTYLYLPAGGPNLHDAISKPVATRLYWHRTNACPERSRTLCRGWDPLRKNRKHYRLYPSCPPFANSVHRAVNGHQTKAGWLVSTSQPASIVDARAIRQFASSCDELQSPCRKRRCPRWRS